jgi:hypothetical protein
MFQFLCGIIVGIILVLIFLYVVYSNFFGVINAPLAHGDQFVPLQLPPELSKFLNSRTNGATLSEPSLGLSLILHFLFQEHKDTRELRRWIHRRVQLELNDLTTRSAVGHVVQDVKIRDLTMGSQLPVVKSIAVEKCKMSESGEGFEELSFLVEVDYKGGFQIAVDANLVVAGYAQLSFKLTHLIGKVRVMLTRHPYALWAFSFSEMPDMDFKVESQLQGRQISYVVPLITSQIRRAIMRKHVWPNYKIRNRPLFPHPLLQPSPQISAFNHIELNGHGLEVTVLQSTRLNIKLANGEQTEVYCTASLDQRPFMHNSQAGSSHSITVLLTVKPFAGEFGVTFIKGLVDLRTKVVKVHSVHPLSPGEKYGFKEGDILLAINNIPVRNERQVSRMFTGLTTDIVVLVERDLNSFMDDNSDPEDVLISSEADPKEDFVCLGGDRKREDINVKRSLSDIPLKSPGEKIGAISSFSNTETSSSKTQSIPTPIPQNRNETYDLFSHSLPTKSELEVFQVRDLGDSPQKIEVKPLEADITRIPKVEVRQPSFDIRRSRSESHLENFGIFDGERKKLFGSVELDKIMNADEIERPNSKESSHEEQEKHLKEESHQHRSRRERIHARASEMALKLNAGAAKVGELWKNRHKTDSPSNADVEFATEASEVIAGENTLPKKSGAISPSPSFKEERSRRKWIRSRKSPTPSGRSHHAAANTPVIENFPRVSSRSTKAVHLDSNVLWGQSLHFTLDKKETKYLNITVQARTPLPKDNVSQISQSDFDNLRPTLLGSVSIFVPQLIADCQLTISNCHREVFALRPPTTINLESFGEISKHAGFDPRLCYGDIKLGFRHFPNGLPESLLQTDNDSINNEEDEASDDATAHISQETSSSPNDVFIYDHQWIPISFKHAAATCNFCQGKIWLKAGSRCKKCHLVVHNKCVVKANKQKECSKNGDVDDDGVFEVLDGSVLRRDPLSSTSSAYTNPPSPSFTDDTSSTYSLFTESGHETTSRRRKFADKISNTFRGLRSSGKVKEKSSVTSDDSISFSTPKIKTVLIKDVLEPDFLVKLKGSPAIYDLNFEPGNAYNEPIINKVKSLGAHVFFEISDCLIRKSMIDSQIDTIQEEINKTTSIRREFEKKTGDNFEIVDNRLQALALLMLHYCSGLQDCEDKMEADYCVTHSDSLLQEPTLPDIAE